MIPLKTKLMNSGPTHFLKFVILMLALATLALGGLLLYTAFESNNVGAYRPILIGMVVSMIPFLLGLREGYKLLNYISNKRAFSEVSVKALKKIKVYALVISGFYAVSLPYIFYAAEQDDAPGVVMLGLILVIAPFVVAVFGAILQELLQNAIEIKSENDLTV